MVGAGEGILGSCTEKTSAPDEANPAGACLSAQGRTALPSGGSHAHLHPRSELSRMVNSESKCFYLGNTHYNRNEQCPSINIKVMEEFKESHVIRL